MKRFTILMPILFFSLGMFSQSENTTPIIKSRKQFGKVIQIQKPTHFTILKIESIPDMFSVELYTTYEIRKEISKSRASSPHY